MLSSDYYTKLSAMRFFGIHTSLIPFVGEKYDEYRILQIGESHYLNQQKDNIKIHIDDFIDDWWNKPCEELLTGSRDWVDTRGVVNRFMDNKKGSYTIFSNVLRSFCSIVLGKDEPHITGEAKRNYNYFSFMNFFQMPSLIEGVKFWDSLDLDDKSKANEMWDICVQKSSDVVDAVIDILIPRMIVFTSLSAGNAYRGKYKTDGRVVYTSHPQAPFSWTKPLSSLGGRTGKEIFEGALRKTYL